MAQISASAPLLATISQKLFAANANSLGYGSPGPTNQGYSSVNSLLSRAGAGGFASAWARFNIMQGTVPFDFSGLTTYGSRSSDILVTFTTSTTGGNSSMFSSSTDNTDPVFITSQFVAATQSGTATWFWLVVTEQTPTGSSTLYHQVIGTVGLPSSGADLEIGDVNIVAPNTYRILNFRITVPTIWNF